MNSRYIFSFCLIGLMAILVGCGGATPLPDKTRRSVDCRYFEEQNNIGLTVKTLNRIECKRLFGSDALLASNKPIYPVLFVIDNNCSKNVVISPDSIALPTVKRQVITKRLHQDTTWNNIGIFLNEFSAADSLHTARNSVYTKDAVNETINALQAKQFSNILQEEAHQKTHHNIAINELLDSLLLSEPVIISAHSRAMYCLFVAEDDYRSVFPVTIKVPDAHDTLTYHVNMKKYAPAWQSTK
ncbi:MAG: hypothetical protein AB7F19_01175 [Candidatus Babeliales bacterium]